MFWDCPSCGSTKLLGKSHRHCPGCGTVQDPSSRYFPAEDEKIAVEDHVFVGVDWSCERCETPNSNATSFCVNCGDARDGVENEVKQRSEVAAGLQSGKAGATPDALGERLDFVEDEPPARRSWLGCLLLVGVVVVVGGAFCLLATFWTESTSVEVTGHSWTRSIEIERFAARSGHDWCDSIPGDAYGVSQSQKQRSTNSVPDGESCSTVNVDNGDGTFSTSQRCSTTYREEPVYDSWCSYTVDRWGHHSTKTADGKGLSPEPSWPTVTVTNCATRGCTRKGSREQTYTVHYLDGSGDVQACTPEQAEWQRQAVGSKWDGEKGVMFDNLVCSSLKPVTP